MSDYSEFDIVKPKCTSLIRLESFEDAESLVENYRREIEIKRLREILETMLIEEDESIIHLSNAAYNDYSLIATEMLPLIDSLLPSIKQFQETINNSINNISEIIQEYSVSINEKINNNKKFLIKKMELILLRQCDREINKYRNIILSTKNRFKKDEVTQCFLSVRVVHYCILKVIKIRRNVQETFIFVSNKCLNSESDFDPLQNLKECFNFCDQFILELKEIIILALNRLFHLKLNKSVEIKDIKHNYNLLLNCIFLLDINEEFVSKIKEYLDSEIISNYDFKRHIDDKLVFSNTIRDFEEIITEKSFIHFIEKVVFSLFHTEDDEYLRYMIDIYIRGVVIYLLEIVEDKFFNQIIAPTAPMELYLHQLNSLIFFVEKNEKLLTNIDASTSSEKELNFKKLKIIIFFRQNYIINNYSKKWKFGTYWNLIYRNILNRRISIRNEAVEFSRVYVYENRKYWLKYTIEIIRQIRWIVGTSSINTSVPLPPSRCMAPLFTRCLYISISLLYDYSKYIFDFNEWCSSENLLENKEQIGLAHPKKLKPEYLCCVVLDTFSFEEWVKDNFLKEIFFHADAINNEFVALGSKELGSNHLIIDVDQLKTTVQNELIYKSYFNHLKENVLFSFKNSISKYLNNQVVGLFDSGLRTLPCLYRLTVTSITNKNHESIENNGNTPSNYVESVCKPIEIFLLFSSNVIKSIKNDLSESILQKLTNFYMETLILTLELIFEDIFVICEEQISSAKNQLASIQKLAQKNIEALSANKIDPNFIIKQYHTDIDEWLSKMINLISNFFSMLNDNNSISVENLNEILKDKPNYVKLQTLLNL